MKFNVNQKRGKTRSFYKIIFILLLVLVLDFYSFKIAYESDTSTKSNLVTTEFTKRKLKVGRVWNQFVGVTNKEISISVSMILNDSRAVLAVHFPHTSTGSVQIVTVSPRYKSVFLYSGRLYTFEITNINSKEKFVEFSLRADEYKF